MITTNYRNVLYNDTQNKWTQLWSQLINNKEEVNIILYKIEIFKANKNKNLSER